MNGEQGKYGPNLVRPRLSFRDGARYANDAKVKVLTMYGDGFCMVQYLTRKDCLYSNLYFWDWHKFTYLLQPRIALLPNNLSKINMASSPIVITEISTNKRIIGITSRP